MKNTKHNILERLEGLLEMQSPQKPFQNIEVLYFVINKLFYFLREVEDDIQRFEIRDLRYLKKKQPDESLLRDLKSRGIHEKLCNRAYGLYVETFEEIRSWGISVIAREINELIKEEENA